MMKQLNRWNSLFLKKHVVSISCRPHKTKQGKVLYVALDLSLNQFSNHFSNELLSHLLLPFLTLELQSRPP